MQNPSDDRSVDDESEWQFSVDDVGDTVQSPAEEASPEAQTLPPLEPGEPSLENVMFVLIGIVGTLLLFVTL